MENTLIDGRYLLQAVAGSGGEARVFRARDESTGNSVALRIGLHPAQRTESPTLPTFFEDWVQLLNSGNDSQYGAYQVFELLEGKTLGQLMEKGPLDPVAWHAFVDQSLAAIDALHEAKWVHGDLNADNFFLTAARWKLLELPFLRLDPPQGRSTMFGSIFTLAPEQIDGAKADARSDIYSLGCLYYYAACGVYPHTGANAVEVAISCLRDAPVSLREKAPGLPIAWSDWVMKMITPQSAKRFPSIFAARQLLGVA